MDKYCSACVYFNKIGTLDYKCKHSKAKKSNINYNYYITGIGSSETTENYSCFVMRKFEDLCGIDGKLYEEKIVTKSSREPKSGSNIFYFKFINKFNSLIILKVNGDNKTNATKFVDSLLNLEQRNKLKYITNGDFLKNYKGEKGLLISLSMGKNKNKKYNDLDYMIDRKEFNCII